MDDTPLSYPSLMVLAPRGRGRPKAKDPFVEEITTRVTSREYERVCKMARDRDQSPSALLRDLIAMTRGRI